MSDTFYIRIEDGVVADRIVFDGAMPEDWPERERWIENSEAQIGWTFVDGEATPPKPELITEPTILPPLSARQFRLGLHANGLLSSVQETIDALDEHERTAAQIEWEYAIQFDRDHHLVISLAAALELTEEQIDGMWQQAMAF